jgi:hypothetical protein
MQKIFGIPLLSFAGRIAYAVVSGAVLLFAYYEIPSFLYKGIGSQLPSYLGGDGFYYYAVLIAVLSALNIVFKGKWLGDAAGIASAISQMTYLYIVANGGILSFAIGGLGASVAVDFRPLLYLLMLPSALMLISTVVGAIGRSSTSKIGNAEEILLS